MPDSPLLIEGTRVPPFLYGTAWKEDDTYRLTLLAIEEGFRGIDTANQRRHYHEAAVGEAVADAIERRLIARDELFLQTKFTFRPGQDHRLPYDAAAPIPRQVEQSFASSLEHLGVETLDSYLLHGPMTRAGLTAPDWEAWRAIESLHDGGRVRLIGVSNFSRPQLAELCDGAGVAPRFVQNRCFAAAGWDLEVRKFCQANHIAYQGFSLLTANRALLAAPELSEIAARHGRSVTQIVFRFALEVGMIPLTGTTNAAHMRDDLDALTFRLAAEEIARIERLAAGENR